jgi:acyl phosphate:glycerol-3-phosphate acyltransferase
VDIWWRDHRESTFGSSKNIGATNVLRVMGKKWGYLVFFCDSLKGFLSVKTGAWLAAYFSGDPTLGAVIGGVACILGHNFPVWLRFKGGKGIATSSGVVLALFPIWLILGLAVLWVAVFLIGRFVSLASIAAAIAFPIGVFFVTPKAGSDFWILVGFSLLIAALGIWRHQTNIVRLMNGTENRFGKK